MEEVRETEESNFESLISVSNTVFASTFHFNEDETADNFSFIEDEGEEVSSLYSNENTNNRSASVAPILNPLPLSSLQFNSNNPNNSKINPINLTSPNSNNSTNLTSSNLNSRSSPNSLTCTLEEIEGKGKGREKRKKGGGEVSVSVEQLFSDPLFLPENFLSQNFHNKKIGKQLSSLHSLLFSSPSSHSPRQKKRMAASGTNDTLHYVLSLFLSHSQLSLLFQVFLRLKQKWLLGQVASKKCSWRRGDYVEHVWKLWEQIFHFEQKLSKESSSSSSPSTPSHYNRYCLVISQVFSTLLNVDALKTMVSSSKDVLLSLSLTLLRSFDLLFSSLDSPFFSSSSSPFFLSNTPHSSKLPNNNNTNNSNNSNNCQPLLFVKAFFSLKESLKLSLFTSLSEFFLFFSLSKNNGGKVVEEEVEVASVLLEHALANEIGFQLLFQLCKRNYSLSLSSPSSASLPGDSPVDENEIVFWESVVSFLSLNSLFFPFLSFSFKIELKAWKPDGINFLDFSSKKLFFYFSIHCLELKGRGWLK